MRGMIIVTGMGTMWGDSNNSGDDGDSDSSSTLGRR